LPRRAGIPFLQLSAADLDDDPDIQLSDILKAHGFECEYYDHTTLSIFPADDRRKNEFLNLSRWQWVQHLAAQRLGDIHAEVFEHFAANPHDLTKLGWRQYEELLDSIFRNQGFRTELGPGTNDGGIDIRLYQSDAIPELVRLVQAKRYTSRPIKLDAVAALFGIAVAERVPRGILATTLSISAESASVRLEHSTTDRRADHRACRPFARY